MEAWELRVGLLITFGVIAMVAALLRVVTPVATPPGDPVAQLNTQWTMGAALTVFAVACTAVGTLQLASHLPDEVPRDSWFLALIVIFSSLGFAFSAFYFAHFLGDPDLLPNDPRRQPSHVLAGILLFSYFFGVMSSS